MCCIMCKGKMVSIILSRIQAVAVDYSLVYTYMHVCVCVCASSLNIIFWCRLPKTNKKQLLSPQMFKVNKKSSIIIL